MPTSASDTPAALFPASAARKACRLSGSWAGSVAAIGIRVHNSAASPGLYFASLLSAVL
jgi:hypothetical protein